VNPKNFLMASTVALGATAIAFSTSGAAHAMSITGFPAPTWSSTGNVAPTPGANTTTTVLYTDSPIPGGATTDATSGAFQSFLGIGAADLDLPPFDDAFEGSALQLAVNPGDSVTLDWVFLPQNSTELDYAFTVFNGTVSNLASTIGGGTFSQTFASAGLFSIGIVDIGDIEGDSTLSLTNAQYDPAAAAIPTPALLPGLIGFGMSIVRKRKQQQQAA